MIDLKPFIKKWDKKELEDWGTTVSKEFGSFQTAFKNIMKKIAESCNAELVKYSKGHYDMSGFIKRDDKYVYFNYSNYQDRATVNLTKKGFGCAMYFRTAASDTDYHGGSNNNVPFSECEETIERLLNTEHRRAW